MLWVSAKRRLPLTIALLIGLIVLGTAISRGHGPRPSAGATYTGTVVLVTRSGQVRRRLPLSFSISADGRRVGAIRFPAGLPTRCPGTIAGTISHQPAVTPLRAPSRFVVSLTIRSAVAALLGHLELSGVFHTFGRADGAVATTFTAAGLRDCGTGGGYVARAGAA
ncbi:hypothetical protein [Conexibacter sp. DBS9H8]|uniref:hypothetical protein n=1 Tax=Conexibacter sp. DBS9H8 TaxID=2937801 RepID=UPI0020100721|nr:hypothetical protein [Conexibacter sp. DBS9H8]